MTHCCLRKELVRRFTAFSLAVVSSLAVALPARAVNLVQEFYLPMPEQQINQANNAIISGTSSSILSTFSIVVTSPGTVIYYDQWEDGYETDLSNPTQPTTQIWGDGNTNNGVAPGYPNDILPVGAVITLTNTVTQPRNPATLLWDARDRIAANKALVISRAGWPVNPGPVFAGAAGVLSTMDYGTNYISPVGQNLAGINLMKYVGMFIMAAQNNTAVTIDPNGNGIGTTNIVLNQGESYLVNGGIMTGGRVSATKPIQADLIIGHVGASYASDWFTLYPAAEWSSSYYTPVGTSKNGNTAYVYLYNPNPNAITINYTTRVGSGSFPVPGTNGVYQYAMPVGSGASFTSAGGQNFYALCTVAANNASDTSYNWGFTLVPKGGLTTEAAVGWGPGSADGTVDGSPVWITALENTTLYVDYKGDHAGPVTDPNGNKCDTNFTVVALQTQKIFDPSKNQTGMRVYTVDGTLIAGAWGEDPDTAQPGDPYIDAGTTVNPFPVPTLIKSAVIVTDAPPAGLSTNDVILYTVQINNQGLLPLGNTVVIDAPTTNLTYITNSTTLNGVLIPDNPGPYSATNTAFPLDASGSSGYTIPVILSQGVSTFQYLVKVNAGGAVSNSVNIGGTTIYSSAYLLPPPTNGASVTLNFTDTNGTPVSAYPIGGNVFVTMTNAVGNTSSNTLQSINVTVVDLTSGDLETLTLVETRTNSGVFRNISGLPASPSSGLGQQDGILYVAAGDILSVNYTDPVYGDSATNSAAIQTPTPNKQLYLTANGTSGVQQMNRVNPVATANFGTNYTSVDLGQNGNSVIALDSVTIASNTASLTVTSSHVTGAGANRLMLVGVSINRGTGGTTFETPTNITYAGVPLVQVGGRTNLTSQEAVIWIFALTNPPTGTNNLIVKWDQTQADGDVIGCATFTGVNQATPYGAFFSNTNTSTATLTNVSVVVASAPGELVFDTVGLRSQNFGAVGSPGVKQATLWKTYFNTKVAAGSSTQPGAALVTNTWTTSGNNDWVIGAISIKPAASAGGSTNFTSFTQTPTFYSVFTMPSGGTVVITNFITVTNGFMPANPAITATLQANGTNFLTLASPTYYPAASNLVWSGALPASVTVPAGKFITYVISNNQSGVAFHVNYGSTNMPSVMVLPATTIIHINSLGVYDAPYPGGSLVAAPVAGSTVYLRASVNDPFGSYDITSLGLAVTGPTPASSFTNILTDVNVVANDNYTKIYEYAETTGPTTGGYNIAATANEGTEGVNVSAATSITTTFLDLGTPSITTFTAGPNGISTNSYPANSPVSVRVSDLNRNTNATTIDTVSVVVTNSAGDYETLTLVETGTNTGIFTNSINVSTNIVGVPDNGVLYAPVGSILTAYYSDPTDPTDNTSATATVQPLPGVPGVVMSKTILSPAGGQVGVSNTITFNLQAINIGSTTLPNLNLNDTFPIARLSYVSARLAPNTTNLAAGLLAWTNLGALAPGQSTNITVTFLTTATGAATNFATANGVTATNASSVTFSINKTALNVTKILLSPTNTPVAVGSNVVFRITVQNTGNTTVNYLPLEDTFSAAYYQFVSSTITNNGAGAGSLIWTNLASPAALAAGATITNDVTMKVVGQGSPANNTATVDFATDSSGNPVPTSSSTIGVNTASASINGHVYNDVNQSGVYTNGDTGLGNVTLQLYTDPNGDGNPSDGTLVQITTTDGNGYYELLNLNTGHYVVVETDLPGYSSSSPANNRLPLNVTNLTATTNANFFNYIPAPSVYSTISGSVWYDSNGNGTNNAGETNLANVEIDLVQDVNSNGVADAGEPVVASTLTAGTNGTYVLNNITPGRYVIRETDAYGYYSTGDSQGSNDNQIIFVSTNGIISTNNDFYDRLSPTAVNDTAAALYFVATNIYPLTNDISPNGDVLTITNASSADGTVVINPGSANLTFMPTNLGLTTITYTIADAHGGAATATITVNVTALADLAIGKTAVTTVFATSNLTYTISVTNFGPSVASSVVVTDTLPTGVAFVNASGGGTIGGGAVTWNLGALAISQASNLTVTVTTPVSGTITNIASVGSPTPDPVSPNNVTPPVTTGVIPVTDIILLNTGPANAAAGTVYTNTISVTNAGPSTATNVVVVDTLPNGVLVTNVVSILPSGSGTNFTVTFTAPPGGWLTNSATGTAGTYDPNPANNTNITAVTAVTAVADLAVGKAGPAGIVFGANFSYTISVTNFGPSTAAGISVTDSLPAGLVFISSVPVATTNASQIIWTNLGSLAAGVTTNLTITVNATARGSVTNIATGGSPTFDPNPTNNTSLPVVTAITNIPPLANPDSYAVTENTTNMLDPLANDAVNTPGGYLTLVSVSATNGTAIISGTNVAFVPATNFLGVATIGYTITDNVGGTNSSLMTITVTNVPPVANPDNYAMGENTTNVSSPLVNDIVNTPGGHLSLISVSPTNGTATISGTNVVFIPVTNFIGVATIGYTITDNVGGTNGSLITVTVTNSVPAANAQSVTTPENTAKPITLAGTDPAHLPLTFVVVTGPTNGALSLLDTNTGLVTYTPNTNYVGDDSFTFRVNNGFASSPSATVSLAVLPVADIVVVQSGPTNGLAGSNLVYIVSVTNLGPATASNLIVTNQLSSAFTFVSASGDGSNLNSVVTWNIASLPLNGVTNLTVTMFAAEGGVFTNIASGLSSATDLNPTNNNGSLANAQARTVITPLADVAVFKDGGTNVFAGQSVDYTITATNAGPSTATNVVVQDDLPAGATLQNASGSYALSNGVVRWPGVTLAPGTAATFTLTLLAPASATSFLNVALATSPTADPDPTNNNGSSSKSRVTTKITPSADVAVLLLGPATAAQGSNFVYTLTLTNAGPSTSSNLVVSDSLPLGLVFVSASSGGKATNNIVTWPAIKALPLGAVTNLTLTVYSANPGFFTNVASALAVTYDPDPTNNSGVLPVSRAQTMILPTQFEIFAGTPALNPQTGLYEETVAVTNTGDATILGFRLHVGGLRSGVTLYNAEGTSNNVPFINYNFPVDPSNAVSVILEFYDPLRLSFTNTLSVEAILPGAAGVSSTNGSVTVTNMFTDARIPGDARFVIEFASVPGKTYVVLYSSDLAAANWNVATPSIKANANVTQWYDDGPPKTVSKPDMIPARFYRVIQY